MHTVRINEGLSKRLAKTPKKDLQRILERISQLKDDPRPRWAEKLRGRPGYRTAVGNYRIIYAIDDSHLHITIIEIDDRKDIYR